MEGVVMMKLPESFKAYTQIKVMIDDLAADEIGSKIESVVQEYVDSHPNITLPVIASSVLTACLSMMVGILTENMPAPPEEIDAFYNHLHDHINEQIKQLASKYTGCSN